MKKEYLNYFIAMDNSGIQIKGAGANLIKVDEDYIYVLSETEGKIDLLDNNWAKVKEIDIEELEA